jgi:hypothetical protein
MLCREGVGGHLKVELICLQEFVSYFLIILQILSQEQGFNLRELGGCQPLHVEGVAQPTWYSSEKKFCFCLNRRNKILMARYCMRFVNYIFIFSIPVPDTARTRNVINYRFGSMKLLSRLSLHVEL